MVDIPTNLVKQFVKQTTGDQSKQTTTKCYGTASVQSDGIYVVLDGSSTPTPVSMATDASTNDRVLVEIENHSARVVQVVNKSNSDKVAESIINADMGIFQELRVGTEYVNTLIAGDITADRITSGFADIDTIKADYITVSELISANEADIKNLKTDKLDAKDADIKYANIDFTNIGKAAMEYFYANSGLIKDATIDNGTITGELIGVTFKGDLIEGNTIVADKLVIKGEDGLYYKLNTNGITTEAQQTDYNSLNGTVIQAKSITAEKISVSDLVAFDAKIGGFTITNNALYSGVKESVDNTTRGTYLDNNGQLAFGDGKSYIKYYKDENDVYKLDMMVDSLKIGAGSTDVGEAMSKLEQTADGLTITLKDMAKEVVVANQEEFYKSSSPTQLTGGSWSKTQPTWQNGYFIWRRTLVTYGDGSTEYTPSENGVCISGNTGEDGKDGIDGGTQYATCGTSSSTTTKVATIADGSEFELTKGVSVAVKFTYSNSAYQPMLNVNNTGAKYICVNGSTMTSSEYYWDYGALVSFIYDGSYWNVVDSGSLSKISDAAKTATNYLNYSSNGLVIGNLASGTLGNNVLIDNDSVDIRNGDTVFASYGANTIYLGKNSKSVRINLLDGFGSIREYNAADAFGKIHERLCIESIDDVVISANSNHNGQNNAIYLQSRSVDTSSGSTATYVNHESSIEVFSGGVSSSSVTIQAYNKVQASGIEDYISSFIQVKEEAIIMDTPGTLGIRSNKTTIYGTTTLKNGNLYLEEGNIYLPNSYALLGYNTSGSNINILHINSNNNIVLGWGNYSDNAGETNIYGREVNIASKWDIVVNCGSSYAFRPSSNNAVDLGTSSYNFRTVRAKYLRSDTGDYNYVSMASSSAYYFGLSSGDSSSSSTCNIRGRTVRLYSHKSGAVYLGTSGSTAITSDENLKDISPIDERFDDFYMLLKPITYIYKDKGHRSHMGFGARQVANALASSGLTTEDFAGVLIDKDVTIGADENGTENDVHYDELYSLRYQEFISLNTHMIQKAYDKIRELENRIKELEVVKNAAGIS